MGSCDQRNWLSHLVVVVVVVVVAAAAAAAAVAVAVAVLEVLTFYLHGVESLRRDICPYEDTESRLILSNGRVIKIQSNLDTRDAVVSNEVSAAARTFLQSRQEWDTSVVKIMCCFRHVKI